MSTDPDNLGDALDNPDDDVYAASWEAFQHIDVPEGLTPDEAHQFWACVETHAYCERKNCLVRLCGDDRDYSDAHMRKQIVVAFHLHKDAELVHAELSRWLDGGDA